MYERIRVGSIITQIRGVSYKPADVKSADDPNAVALLRANNIQEAGVNYDDLVYVDRSKVSSDQYLRAGDILICSSSGSKSLVGKAVTIPCDLPFAFGAFCKVVRTNTVDKMYLGQYFQSPRYRREISNASAGANINNIRNEHIDNMLIPRHSASKQQEIASVLSQMDSLIGNCQHQLAKLDELVKSRFIEMFGDPVKNPMRWQSKPAKQLMTKIGSGATPKGGNSAYIDEGMALIRSMHVYNGCFDYDDLAHINEEQAHALDGVTVENNDVLLNITGASVARCCIVPDDILPARVNQHVCILRCRQDTVLPAFVNAMLISDSYQDLLWQYAESAGATRQALTKQQIENLRFILPPIELQKQYESFRKQVDKSKFAVQQSIEKLETLKKSLMQKYFG